VARIKKRLKRLIKNVTPNLFNLSLNA